MELVHCCMSHERDVPLTTLRVLIEMHNIDHCEVSSRRQPKVVHLSKEQLNEKDHRL